MARTDTKVYDYVQVQLRGDNENVRMPASNGVRLMSDLTEGDTGSHVWITDINGNDRVINKSDIRQIIPVVQKKNVVGVTPNDMPALGERPEVSKETISKLHEQMDKIRQKNKLSSQ